MQVLWVLFLLANVLVFLAALVLNPLLRAAGGDPREYRWLTTEPFTYFAIRSD